MRVAPPSHAGKLGQLGGGTGPLDACDWPVLADLIPILLADWSLVSGESSLPHLEALVDCNLFDDREGDSCLIFWLNILSQTESEILDGSNATGQGWTVHRTGVHRYKVCGRTAFLDALLFYTTGNLGIRGVALENLSELE